VLEKLRESVEDTDHKHQNYLSGLSESDLSAVLDCSYGNGEAIRLSREAILLEVLTHGSFHRGPVGRIPETIPDEELRDLYSHFLQEPESAQSLN